MRNKIYAYALFANYKYIIAFNSSSVTSKPYIAMYGTDKKYKAIWIALREHFNDKLDWVVIENYKTV